jgi:N-acetylmuramoyl-L-alanine amidase
MLRSDTSLPCQFQASPNHGERRGEVRPTLLILHYTGMPSAEGAIARLCDPKSDVSSH